MYMQAKFIASIKRTFNSHKYNGEKDFVVLLSKAKNIREKICLIKEALHLSANTNIKNDPFWRKYFMDSHVRNRAIQEAQKISNYKSLSGKNLTELIDAIVKNSAYHLDKTCIEILIKLLDRQNLPVSEKVTNRIINSINKENISIARDFIVRQFRFEDLKVSQVNDLRRIFGFDYILNNIFSCEDHPALLEMLKETGRLYYLNILKDFPSYSRHELKIKINKLVDCVRTSNENSSLWYQNLLVDILKKEHVLTLRDIAKILNRIIYKYKVSVQMAPAQTYTETVYIPYSNRSFSFEEAEVERIAVPAQYKKEVRYANVELVERIIASKDPTVQEKILLKMKSKYLKLFF